MEGSRRVRNTECTNANKIRVKWKYRVRIVIQIIYFSGFQVAHKVISVSCCAQPTHSTSLCSIWGPVIIIRAAPSQGMTFLRCMVVFRNELLCS